jgi:hypothetical protein
VWKALNKLISWKEPYTYVYEDGPKKGKEEIRYNYIPPAIAIEREKSNPGLLLQPDVGTQLDKNCFNAVAEVFMDEGYIERYKDENGLFIVKQPEKVLPFTMKNAKGDIVLIPGYKNDLSVDVNQLHKILGDSLY